MDDDEFVSSPDSQLGDLSESFKKKLDPIV